MMNRVIAAAAVSGLLMAGSAVSGVMAADLPVAMSAPQTFNSAVISSNTAASTWTGFYLGGHLGGVTSNDFSEHNSALMGGVQAGYTHQIDAFVLGAELQASLADALHYELVPGADLKQNWSVAAKGLAGVAFGNTMLYGTAGLSVAELEPSGATTSSAETHAGAVFGAGVEHAFGNGISLRAEYLQTRYFDVNSTVGGIGRTDELTNHAITAGVNFRF